MARGTAGMKQWELLHQAKMMDVQTTTSCPLCGWSRHGWLATNSEAYTAHRLEHHPEIQPKPRRKRHRLHGMVATRPLEENIQNARKQGAAGWAGTE